MFGAIDISDLISAQKEKENRKKELSKTEEGRKILAEEKAAEDSFNNIPEGALAYKITKLGRLPDPENPNPPQVSDGTSGAGYIRVMTDEYVKFLQENKEEKFTGIPWECQRTLKPKIGSVLAVDGVGNWLRTSIIKSYFVFEDLENYAEHPDKLVLPKEFPIKSLSDITFSDYPFKPGDYVLCTMNSLYVARAIEEKRFKKNNT